MEVMMRLLMIKIFLFILITTVALFNYRILTIHNNRLLLANFDQRYTWNEVIDLIPEVQAVEVYETRGTNRNNSDYEYYIVFYTKHNLYNVKATEADLIKVGNLLRLQQVRAVEIDPVELWFYGLLYLLIFTFPIMRKIED
jgi:nicotinamide mononucleotide adenylyltransferase